MRAGKRCQANAFAFEDRVDVLTGSLRADVDTGEIGELNKRSARVLATPAYSQLESIEPLRKLKSASA